MVHFTLADYGLQRLSREEINEDIDKLLEPTLRERYESFVNVFTKCFRGEEDDSRKMCDM